MIRFMLPLALLPLPLMAEPMNADAFDAYTRGKTLFFAESGEVYGAEIYRDNRRVTWSFLDGECKDGYWYQKGPEICFIYEDDPEDPQCWIFEEGAGGLSATPTNSGSSGGTLYEAQDLNQEMLCLGPKIGV